VKNSIWKNRRILEATPINNSLRKRKRDVKPSISMADNTESYSTSGEFWCNTN
jgi:hypothetical protein